MHAVVLSFPGHFFQSLLSLQSLLHHYPESKRITLILDDVQCEPWSTYCQDVAHTVRKMLDDTLPISILRISEFDDISQCVAGWWRQQLVKLTLDQWVDGDAWFVVDGDTIFVDRCDVIGKVPFSFRNDWQSNFSKMSQNYVRQLLGTPQGNLEWNNQNVCTNAIPFRYLAHDLLRQLRSHIESRFNKRILSLHLDWFDDQTIVADWNPPERMVMSEWELIECYRRYVLQDDVPLVDLGSGYDIGTDLWNMPGLRNRFFHAYRRDTEINRSWFEQRIQVPDSLWQQALAWYQSQESHRSL